MQPQNDSSHPSFSGLGIAPGLLDILEKLGFKHPTPIQLQAIPPALEGKDVMGIAQTGTGKTLAFGIPMLQKLASEKGQGLIILPTRELADQVDQELHKIGKAMGLKTAVLIGGVSMKPQITALSRKPHIIVATPGRLLDHMEQKIVKLDMVNILVLDEADRMLDMGFQPQIKRILGKLPRERQTMLFSATLPHEIMAIATGYMKLPVRIEVAPSGTASQNVSQEIFIVRKDAKPKLLEKILREHSGSTLIFARTKHGVKKVTKLVHALGHTAAEIHGNRSQVQRRDALAGFKSGKFRVLVATDIASRGIDVRGIELVINFDFPAQSEDYVHRIGRTGRAGAEGHAISFALPEERNDIRSVERLIRKSLPVSTHTPTGETSPEMAASLAAYNAPRDPFPRRGGGRRPGGSRGQGGHRGGQGGGQSFGRREHRGGGGGGGGARPPRRSR